MVEVDQMLAPQMVERLQHDRALDIGHHLGAETAGAVGGGSVGGRS